MGHATGNRVVYRLRTPKERAKVAKLPPYDNEPQMAVYRRARKNRLSVKRISVLVSSREWGFSRRQLCIGGHPCRVHDLKAVRLDEYTLLPRYSMLGLRKDPLLKSTFTILVRAGTSGDEFFVVPNRVLLEKFGKSEEFKRFYVPMSPPPPLRPWHRRIDWFSFKDAWDLLSTL